ncbi:MAG: hypothetical protein GKR90_12880 [Pseudomonadales bacterium]|nr:hypothetical protein [Pseudomonadales bacterium]
MKILLNVMLVLNGLTELLASLTLILGPAGVSAAGSGAMWSMHYGFAALAIASISVWSWPHRSNLSVMTTVIGILLVFHSGLCVSLALAGDQAAGMVIHGVTAVMCVVLFVRRGSLSAT